jgi:3-oxoacyl-(acyl-carrier-protein) synthase/SAM-dependent methyltransferase
MGASTAEIAIIGMSGRFPGAETLEDFWRNLRQGVESIGPVSEEELLASGVACSVFSRPDYVKVASTLPRIDRFDAELFGISQRVAEIMDPQQRLFLECAWAALEDAGYDPQRYPGAIGVFAGASPNTYLHHNLKGREDLAAAVGDAQLHFSNDGHYLATTTSYRLDLRGPSVNVQTACSTSLVAVHLAAQSLLLGECDIALAGGVCLRVPHRAGYLFLEGGIASPDGRCRPFDVRARGTVGGMGLGIVVLRRLSDAIEQQDSIRAVIRGSAINNDGARKIGFAAPSVDGQVRVISDALAVAEVPAASIQVIEAHGTATQLGDPLEVEALSQIFGGRERSLPPIALGSVKGNIGHLDVAAGVAGLIKVVLAMAAKEIPPSLHFERPNPELLLDRGPFLVQRALGPWNPGIGPRRAGVSSFGIGGTNAHVILQEPPPPESRVEPSGLPQLLCLSANSRSALQRAALRLADFFEQHPDTELADAAFTLQVGRRELRFRSSVMASSCDQAIRALRAISSGEPASAVQRDTPVILDLLEDSDRVAFEVLALVSEDADLRPILEHCIGLLGDHPAAALLLDGSGLARSLVAGPVARFVVAQSLAQLLVESGAQLDGLRGWGLGEVVAACLAGALPLKEGLWLAVQRGLSEHGPAELAAETHRQLLHRLSTSPLPSPQIRLAALRYGTEWLDRWLPSAGAPLAPVLAPKLGQIVFELGSRPEALKAGARCWLLKTLGRIWCSGAQVHWARLWRDRSVRRIALPTYPFEPQRFWIEPTRGDEDPRWSEVLAVGKRVASVHRPELEAEYSEKERWLHRLSVETMRSALWGLGLFRGSEVARSAEELARQGRVIPRYQQLLSDWLRLLTAEGYLRQAEGGFASARPWTPSALPHLIEQGRRAWANEPEWLETVVRCGAHLPEILTGARDALPSVLGSANKLGAEAAHASPLFRYFNQLIAAIGAQLAGMWSESGPMRALELGIGSGLTTAGLLPALGGRVQYTATDVNRAYLQQARTKFGQSPMIDFLLLDIERPPSEQGIASGGYHLVVAANVLHVTSDLRRALQHVREVLAPGGILLLWEITRPQAAFMATAGLLMNRLEDGARTQGNPFLSADEWSAALHGAGFDRIARFPDTDTLGYHVLLAQGSSAQVVVAPPARSEAAEVDDCFYLPSWRRAPLRPVRPDPASGEFPHIQVRGGRCWLIFLDPLGVGAALARGLERSGAPVFQIEAGGSLEQRGDRRFALRLTSTDDLDALLARLGEEGWIPDRVVHLWNVSTELPSAWSAENLVAYDALLALIQSMVRAAPGGGGHHVHLWVVSSSLQNVTGDEVIDPSRALLLGPVRVASQEHPNMVCRSVDLDPSPSRGHWPASAAGRA